MYLTSLPPHVAIVKPNQDFVPRDRLETDESIAKFDCNLLRKKYVFKKFILSKRRDSQKLNLKKNKLFVILKKFLAGRGVFLDPKVIETRAQRPNWDEYFLNMAMLVASRSSCLRNQVGAVIVKEKDVISTGYNGAPKYQKNCLELGWCYRDQNGILSGTQLEKCRAVGSHAESNAIALAARNGHSTRGTTIYIVGHDTICNQCKAQIANAEIRRVVLRNKNNETFEYFPERDWTIHPIDQMEG